MMDVPIAANVLGTMGAVGEPSTSQNATLTEAPQVCWSVQVS